MNENDFAIDVSDYQDINDLYIVSDLLITDYSSVFFDYANLKKPMIFYAYDLEEYAGEIRGFYFDYVEEAPGPILTQEEQVYQEIEKQLETPQLAKLLMNNLLKSIVVGTMGMQHSVHCHLS